MKLASIHISTVSAKLGVQKEPTSMEIRQPMADMTMRQPQADIQYRQKDAEIRIDQSEAFADAGLKPISQHIQEWAAKGRQQALEATAKAARQGDQLMNIAKGGSGTIQRIAKENSEDPIREVNIGFMPSSPSRVKIDYIPGELDIKINQKSPEIEIKPNYPIIKVRPGDTDIYLKQKPSILFSVVGLNIDYKK